MSTTAASRQIKPHPLNKDFAWSMPEPRNLRALSEAQYRQFNDEGFVKLEGVFTPAEVAAVIAAIDPLEVKAEEHLRSMGGRVSISEADVITFTTHIVKKSDVLKRFAAHPKIQAICHDLIGGDVRLYWDQSVYKKTGKAQEFPWHQDNGYTFIEPQQYLTLWIPLVDVDEENGCPWIAPKLHKGGTLEHWLTPIGLKCLEAAPDAVSVPGKAGDVIAFSSLAPHRTGPNLKTGSVRKAYILQYAPDNAYTVRDGKRVRQDDPERQFLITEAGP
ncbi:MAG: phytanoyl-CoA dioxygenase family protein [Alphaproteobacteria bacterium]|nr:phytanoyl-CoA dioxygenase family protein [Alphaproteobacteria bacterium]MBV9904930.1 phytanoyl-CoA dioxygenase family protein [Alphaproteobacteria bacterium]